MGIRSDIKEYVYEAGREKIDIEGPADIGNIVFSWEYLGSPGKGH